MPSRRFPRLPTIEEQFYMQLRDLSEYNDSRRAEQLAAIESWVTRFIAPQELSKFLTEALTREVKAPSIITGHATLLASEYSLVSCRLTRQAQYCAAHLVASPYDTTPLVEKIVRNFANADFPSDFRYPDRAYLSLMRQPDILHHPRQQKALRRLQNIEHRRSAILRSGRLYSYVSEKLDWDFILTLLIDPTDWVKHYFSRGFGAEATKRLLLYLTPEHIPAVSASEWPALLSSPLFRPWALKHQDQIPPLSAPDLARLAASIPELRSFVIRQLGTRSRITPSSVGR